MIFFEVNEIRGQWPLISYFGVFGASWGNLMHWFGILFPFVMHICRNRLISHAMIGHATTDCSCGVPRYTNKNDNSYAIFLFLTPLPKWSLGGGEASQCILQTIRNVLFFFNRGSSLLKYEYRWNRILTTFRSLTWPQVNGWPRTINSGIKGNDPPSFFRKHCQYFSQYSFSFSFQKH